MKVAFFFFFFFFLYLPIPLFGGFHLSPTRRLPLPPLLLCGILFFRPAIQFKLQKERGGPMSRPFPPDGMVFCTPPIYGRHILFFLAFAQGDPVPVFLLRNPPFLCVRSRKTLFFPLSLRARPLPPSTQKVFSCSCPEKRTPPSPVCGRMPFPSPCYTFMACAFFPFSFPRHAGG